jgi:hypothetical protein
METDIFTNIKIIIYEVKVYKNDKATHVNNAVTMAITNVQMIT